MKWAVILAGGNGSRLQPLTRLLTGDDRPKQFCPLLGDKTLLAQTRARVALNVPATRCLCVVTREHEPYYRRELRDMTPRQVIEQPANRGTAAAIAYAVARVGRQDSKAVIGLFPADHHYEDPGTLRRVVDQTYRAAQQRPELVFLLGTEPDAAEIEYGWIEPDRTLPRFDGQVYGVSRFWEKPAQPIAEDLLRRGCLWNMFVMIGSLGAFRSLIHAALPDTARAFELVEQIPIAATDTVERVYQSLTPADFSRDVLARHTDRIAVVRVPRVGWTDLGQPARVNGLLTTHGAAAAALSVA